VHRLVIDLRGNPGGGIGGLHLMSYLTPAKLPIGYSVDRPTAELGYDKARLPRLDHIPKSKLEIPFLALKFFWEEIGSARNGGPWHSEFSWTRRDSRERTHYWSGGNARSVRPGEQPRGRCWKQNAWQISLTLCLQNW
jgi:hypothetical protein